MILVMPFGRATPFGAARGTGALSNTELFEKYLITDVMPFVEQKYRISANHDNRAIAGMSMGGEQALAIGFGHMELFSSIGALSPSLPTDLATSLGTRPR
jgi:enterochelin esterase-like enzyme